jgi:acetate kinase
MIAANILVLNAGSATLKYAVYGPLKPTSAGACLARGHVDVAAGGSGASIRNAIDAVANAIDAYAIAAVGPRIVHGGAKYVAPVLLDDDVVAALATLRSLAPLHQALGLAVVHAARDARPDVSHVAAFDTAFHASMPMVARHFALPQVWFERGVRRFGFHGLSYEFIASTLRELRAAESTPRTVVAHLGSGASLCAMRDGASVATTMSFTPTDGLMMATRSGSLDPSAVLHLQRDHGLDVEAVERLLNLESGLLGVSGISGDIRVLLASDEPAAQFALELFVHRIVVEIGAMAAALGGLDELVFTGGIGSHQPRIRERVCAALAWLGIACDRTHNERGDSRFDETGSRVILRNIPTDEESVIAQHTMRLLPERRSTK